MQFGPYVPFLFIGGSPVCGLMWGSFGASVGPAGCAMGDRWNLEKCEGRGRVYFHLNVIRRGRANGCSNL